MSSYTVTAFQEPNENCTINVTTNTTQGTWMLRKINGLLTKNILSYHKCEFRFEESDVVLLGQKGLRNGEDSLN